MYKPIICGFLGFGICFAVVLMTLRMHRLLKITERQDEFHHGHGTPLSRLGGIALATAFVCVAIVSLVFFQVSLPLVLSMALSALAMFGLGLWDDLRALGAKRKLLFQLVIATVAYCLGISVTLFKIPFIDKIIELGWWSWPATVLWLVAMTNLINLVDGVDGLAGGISLMLMLLMAVVGGVTSGVSYLAAGMAGALVAFLLYNFPPAKIYMGDGGAYFLGFLIGVLTITSSHKGTVAAALVAPLFVLALPILDTSLAILRRGLHGLPLFRADRHHIHHQLLESGLSRQNVVLGLYAFTAFFLGLGFIVFLGRGQYFSLIMGGGILAVLLAVGRFNLGGHWLAAGRILGDSLNMRSEIQYALAQTRWLVMEGSRCRDIAELSEDTVFIARKLGYDRVRIRLEDADRSWHITPTNDNELCFYGLKLPGHRSAFIELGVLCSKVRNDSCEMQRRQKGLLGVPCTKARAEYGENMEGNSSITTVPKDYRILSELLSEGWANSMVAWKRKYNLPLRFDGQHVSESKDQSGSVPSTQPLQPDFRIVL